MNEPYTKEELQCLAGFVMLDIRETWNNYGRRLCAVVNYLSELRFRFDDQDAKKDLEEIEKVTVDDDDFDGRSLWRCRYYGRKPSKGITPRVLEKLKRVCVCFEDFNEVGYFDVKDKP